MAESKNLLYRFVNAEMVTNDVTKPDAMRSVITCDSYTVNGEKRKSKRVNFTLAQTRRTGFDVKLIDADKRIVEVILPSERSGRPRKTGTDLAAAIAALKGSR